MTKNWRMLHQGKEQGTDSAERTAGEDDLVQRLRAEADGCFDLVSRASVEKRFREAFGVAAALFNEAANRIESLQEATPAPSSPGVPDSVRALRAACQEAWEHPHIFAARRRIYQDALVEWVETLLSAHPAGQSTGQGAISGDRGEPDPEAEAYANAGLVAPDSTRTGPVGAEDLNRRATKMIRQCFARAEIPEEISKDTLRAAAFLIGDLEAAMIAARPAAPEAQGAERVRHVKRGTEYEVLHRGVELQVATPSAAYGAEYVLPEGAALVVYQGSDGKLWAREEEEFEDGRFVPAPPASSGQDSE